MQLHGRPIKTIAIDIDGSYATGLDISDFGYEVLRRVEAEGVSVVVVTGRCEAAALAIADRAQLATPVISCTGSLVTDPQTRERLAINPLADRDVEVMLELADEEGDPEAQAEVERDLAKLGKDVEALEVRTLLSGEYDDRDALITIRAEAGGVDAADFAEMLMRMYLRWADRHHYSTEVYDTSYAEEAGIKSATFTVKEPFAYGTLSVEQGTHRLVRISPFDNLAIHFPDLKLDTGDALSGFFVLFNDGKPARADIIKAKGLHFARLDENGFRRAVQHKALHSLDLPRRNGGAGFQIMDNDSAILIGDELAVASAHNGAAAVGDKEGHALQRRRGSLNILFSNFVYGTFTVFIHTALHNLRQNLLVSQQLFGSLIIVRIKLRLSYRVGKLIFYRVLLFHRHSLPRSRFNKSV